MGQSLAGIPLAAELPVNSSPRFTETTQPFQPLGLGLEPGDGGSGAGCQTILRDYRDPKQTGNWKTVYRTERSTETLTTHGQAAFEVAPDSVGSIVQLDPGDSGARSARVAQAEVPV